jgi:citrate synthase
MSQYCTGVSILTIINPASISEHGGRERVTQWIGAAEAAERLGIKPASLYAYVSRGVLSRRREPSGRGSLFDAGEVEQLARRGKPRRARTPGSELVIESSVTEITGDSLRYRGMDATELARTRSFEDVALLLWTGSLPDDSSHSAGRYPAQWQATEAALAAGTAAQAALPAGTLPLERLQVIVPALAATDQFRLHQDRPAVVAAGQALIAGMTGSLPGNGPADGPIAARLAARLCTRARPPAGLADVLGVALVLVADHELAASTLAARIAASMRADPYAVVATGLGALGGAVHGGASLGAELLLAAAASPADVPRVVGHLLRRGERLPGFGHFVYRDGDPRANLLLAVTAEFAAGSPRLAVAQAMIAEAQQRAIPKPNIEFALAVLADVAGMVRGAGEAIFATGRTAGWLAHALEEYERNVPIRPRGVYTGPPAAG